jgi:aspartate/methionine/tyrosine aminotransferase
MSAATLSLAKRMANLGTESAFEVLARAKALEAQGKSIVNLGIGSPDFRTPENIVEAGIKALRDGLHFYTPAKGLLVVREAVCEYLNKYWRVKVDPEHVLIVPGGKPTMHYAIELFGEPGAEILYPNPGFPIYESLIRFTGATPVPIALREESGFSFSAAEVLSKITPKTRLLILNTPANPTGGVVPKAELDKLAAGLEAHPHVAIPADEIDSRMTYDGEQHTCFLSYEALRDRTILLDGWSKTFSMTGWRLGFGVWPAKLIAHAERLQINSVSCASAPVQMAGREALLGPQTAVEAMMKTFDERRRLIVSGLNDIPGISCVNPKGAFYAFPNVKQLGMSAKELELKLLNEAGVAILSGTAFGAFGEGYLRFSYASSTDNIREALRRVKDCLAAAGAKR